MYSGAGKLAPAPRMVSDSIGCAVKPSMAAAEPELPGTGAPVAASLLPPQAAELTAAIATSKRAATISAIRRA